MLLTEEQHKKMKVYLEQWNQIIDGDESEYHGIRKSNDPKERIGEMCRIVKLDYKMTNGGSYLHIQVQNEDREWWHEYLAKVHDDDAVFAVIGKLKWRMKCDDLKEMVDELNANEARRLKGLENEQVKN